MAVDLAFPSVHTGIIGANILTVRIDETFGQDIGASVGELIVVTTGGSETVGVDVAVERNMVRTRDGLGVLGVPLEVDIDEVSVGIDLGVGEGRVRGILVAVGLGVGAFFKGSPVTELTVDGDGGLDGAFGFGEVRDRRESTVLYDIDDGFLGLEIVEVIDTVGGSDDITTALKGLGRRGDGQLGSLVGLVDTAVHIPGFVFAELEFVTLDELDVLQDESTIGFGADIVNGTPVGFEERTDDGPCGGTLDGTGVGLFRLRFRLRVFIIFRVVLLASDGEHGCNSHQSENFFHLFVIN